jgi:hypothetical protein
MLWIRAPLVSQRREHPADQVDGRADAWAQHRPADLLRGSPRKIGTARLRQPNGDETATGPLVVYVARDHSVPQGIDHRKTHGGVVRSGVCVSGPVYAVDVVQRVIHGIVG